jgi:hypothetical protein
MSLFIQCLYNEHGNETRVRVMEANVMGEPMRMLRDDGTWWDVTGDHDGWLAIPSDCSIALDRLQLPEGYPVTTMDWQVKAVRMVELGEAPKSVIETVQIA